jgi:predicted ATP-grasp superfamily ATP-dependent carboligase
VPFPGDVIAAGRPVCSLYAAGATAAECLGSLRELAARVERDLSPPGPHAVPATGAEPLRTADA